MRASVELVLTNGFINASSLLAPKVIVPPRLGCAEAPWRIDTAPKKTPKHRLISANLFIIPPFQADGPNSFLPRSRGDKFFTPAANPRGLRGKSYLAPRHEIQAVADFRL
jgi:hypothetical protein